MEQIYPMSEKYQSSLLKQSERSLLFLQPVLEGITHKFNLNKSTPNFSFHGKTVWCP